MGCASSKDTATEPTATSPRNKDATTSNGTYTTTKSTDTTTKNTEETSSRKEDTNASVPPKAKELSVQAELTVNGLPPFLPPKKKKDKLVPDLGVFKQVEEHVHKVRKAR
jgi:hypothetical protein